VGSGGGNHRGSIFRLIAGTALIARDGHKFPTWGEGGSAAKNVKETEVELECAVSEIIRKMPFLWLAVAAPAQLLNLGGPKPVWRKGRFS
jgi:hypothetical protein